MKPLSPQAMKFAKKLIRDVIDLEHKYVPDAAYETTGKKLKEYLAFAYQEGQRAEFCSTVSRKG